MATTATYPQMYQDTRYPAMGRGTAGSMSQSGSVGVASMVQGWAEEVANEQRSTPDEPLTTQMQQSKQEASNLFLPPGAQRRVVERYELDGTPSPDASLSQVLGQRTSRYSSAYNASLVPISPNPRAYAQQPTYITTPQAQHPVYSPSPPQQEEVCVECNMRDQDMVDVDVTTPGVWARESDAGFEELLRRERQEEMAGIVNQDPTRAKSKGGRLTESNIKIWLTMNPKEPASRLNTLEKYIKSQRLLLEADALAHARAMVESRQLDNQMRDAYSHLRRSAYETGNAPTVADEPGGVRIKSPRSASTPAPGGPKDRGHSRDITLLENGMIVEHVDVRKEEREERERRRREEKRARKSSRSSGVEPSLYSVASGGPHADSGVGLKPHSRYSHASSARPMSVLTAPLERQDRPPSFPRAYSQASFSDVHSLGSASPRRTRFFGFKNLSAGWRSQDSLAQSGMSGSMVDMHVALQRENALHPQEYAQSSRQSQIWPPVEPEPELEPQSPIQLEEPKKKKSGFKKIWRIVTGSSSKIDFSSNNSRDVSLSMERTEDNAPLAPPPPLSYLVNNRREPSNSSRHQPQSPSIASTSSPRNGRSSQSISPPTAPSSVLPSPVSARPPMPERQPSNDGSRLSKYQEDDYRAGDGNTPEGSGASSRNTIHPVTSEPDLRNRRRTASTSNGNLAPPMPHQRPLTVNRPMSVASRDKMLPPLPGESHARPYQGQLEARPTTLFTYDPRSLSNGEPQQKQEFLPPRAPFRGTEPRRQSFSGMASRPTLQVQTLPANGRRGGDLTPQYDEFGGSRRSFVDEGPTTPSTKRKSKFALSSLLGGSKKSQPQLQQQYHEFPALGTSVDDGGSYIPTVGSRNSTFSVLGGTRMSLSSRKAIESVAQDADFVAYRYPSNAQRLDLR